MAKKPAKPKMGRPPLPPESRRLASMGFRPTPDLRKRLEVSASANHRSISQEIESRLEQTFVTADASLEVFGDTRTYNVMRTIGSAAAAVSDEVGKSWLEDRDVFHQAEIAIHLILRGLGPLEHFEGASLVKGMGREVAAERIRKYANDLEGVRSDKEEEEELRAIGREIGKRIFDA